MNRNESILTELNAISPMLAAISSANQFTVPVGYFDHLPQTVLVCVQEETGETSKAEILTDVPVGYFDELSGDILSKIKQREGMWHDEAATMLEELPKINPFELPAGYFEGLAETVVRSVVAEPELPAVLLEARPLNPYQIPSGYFEKLPENIIKSLPAAGAKLVSIPISRRIFRYAAAAVITGALALGVYQFASKPADTVTVAVQLEPGIEQGIKIDDKKFDEMLSNLSDDDVLQYLEKNGTDVDIAVLAKNLNENSLPAQEDYLLDETTLDQFIKDINLKN